MNMTEVLNAVYGYILPYAAILDGNTTNCTIYSVLKIIYFISLPICFLRSIYLIPTIVIKLDSTNTFEEYEYDGIIGLVILVVCIAWVVLYTGVGIVHGPWVLNRGAMRMLLSYSTGRNVK